MSSTTCLMLRSDPAQPGRVSKQARTQCSAFLPSLIAHSAYSLPPFPAANYDRLVADGRPADNQ